MSKHPRYRIIEKRVGETPLAALERFRKTEPRLTDLPMTYAGRLDPMATGELLILIGDECKKKDEYTSFDKAYEFEILLGISSDSGDVLGLPRVSDSVVVSNDEITSALRAFIGKQTFPYPAFSSKPVKGKPLFQHARLGTLGEIEIPRRDVQIYKTIYLGKREVSAQKLLHEIEVKIAQLKIDDESMKVGADFRKEEILGRWYQLLKESNAVFTVLKCEAIVSSGSYIRVLVEKIGEKLGAPALALSINRTKIGRFQRLFRGFGLWIRVL